MTEKAERLLEALLELPREERIELFDRLGASLVVAEEPPISEAWRAELRDRIARVDRGESELIELDDLERELWAEQDAEERGAAVGER